MKYLRFILLLLFMSVSCFATETIKISALTDGSSSVTTGTWLVGTIVDTTYKFSASSLVGLYLGTLTNDKYCKYNSATGKIDCIYAASGLADTATTALSLTLADDGELSLPAALPEVDSFFKITSDGTMSFVAISDYSGIPSYGELTTEHVAVWYNDDGTWKLKAGDLPSTDNTTNGKLVKKVVDEGVHTLEDAEAGTDYAAPNADTTGTASKLPVNEATDASGEESVDSTSGQYRNYDGTRQNVFSPTNSFSIVIPAPADTDDINILKAPYGMTILGIDCIVQGTTSVTGQIQECSSAGASCADLDSDITCDADGAADDGTLTDSAIATGAWLRWKTTSVSGTPTFLTVTVRYRVVAD